LANLKQLQLALLMYADDNDETFPAVKFGPGPSGEGVGTWAFGTLGWMLNNQGAQLSIVPYVKNISEFSDPGLGTSKVYEGWYNPDWLQRKNCASLPIAGMQDIWYWLVFSVYGMNTNFGMPGEAAAYGTTWYMRVVTQASMPDPAKTLVLIDAMNYAAWAIGSSWVEFYPGEGDMMAGGFGKTVGWDVYYRGDEVFASDLIRHGGMGANATFADGHAKWCKPAQLSGKEGRYLMSHDKVQCGTGYLYGNINVSDGSLREGKAIVRW